ncbi:MFS transporter [Alteriqipengyuania lutimaris]|uniref:MFS transporter n=1 Tax=Alteriqipengyuania lutimaris TaxID=1538146 RepID=A0A395LN73_9SPHN|nr:MFS transporter [Alteriqipengyuania lutimaris]MBB3032598.1 MFS family permease [Alteriqipengyuania lutimaris]RDS78281.1 MFS transporter [Alteriqipengyuania lutimaris]
MTTLRLLRRQRFLPLFCTQLLNAFNDNLYKTAMVLFVVYAVYNDPDAETRFSAIASALFIAPFILVSAIAGQLADMRDKAKIIRTVKLCEIGLMSLGAVGLFLAWQGLLIHSLAIPLMLFALFLAGLQSTFLGPIKYAILPQHLRKEEVLAGTGLVEAGTYLAILLGTIIAGWIPVEAAIVLIIVTAMIGYASSRKIPTAPALGEIEPIDWNILRSSLALVRSAKKDRVIYLAIISISVFWMVGAILFIQFPPLAKNVIHASKEVATLFIVMFSIGIAIGSVIINHLLAGEVSARYGPAAVVVMGFFIVLFYIFVQQWPTDFEGAFLTVPEFLAYPLAWILMGILLLVAVAGGVFVVPLYAFLTTRVSGDRASRTIAATNMISSLFMVGGAVLAILMTAAGLPITEQVLASVVLCLVTSWVARRLHAEEHLPTVHQA